MKQPEIKNFKDGPHELGRWAKKGNPRSNSLKRSMAFVLGNDSHGRSENIKKTFHKNVQKNSHLTFSERFSC